MTNVIGFAPNLVPLILNGTKTLTYRKGEKYDFLKVGDEIDVKDSSNGKVFAKVKIINKTYRAFSDLPINGIGHEFYSSKQEMRETFEKYYGEIKDTDKLLVLEFSVIKKLND